MGVKVLRRKVLGADSPVPGARTNDSGRPAPISALLPPASARLVLLALLTLAAVPLFRRTLGGATGDTFGALTKVVELACYAALVAMWA